MNIQYEDDGKQKYQSVTASVTFVVPSSYDFNHQAYGATEGEARENLLSGLRVIAQHFSKTFGSILENHDTTTPLTTPQETIMKNLPNKVTPGAIEHILAQSKTEFVKLGKKTTHCMITVPSGFEITGESSCIDPTEYTQVLGEKFSKERAVQTLYMLEGYLLASERMEQEARKNRFTNLVFRHSELGVMIEEIRAEINAGKPPELSPAEWAETVNQHNALTNAAEALDSLINLAREPELKENTDV